MIGREILSPAVWGRTIKQDEHPASFVYLQARPRKIVVHLSAPLRAAHTERADRQGQHLQSLVHVHIHTLMRALSLPCANTFQPNDGRAVTLVKILR